MDRILAARGAGVNRILCLNRKRGPRPPFIALVPVVTC